MQTEISALPPIDATRILNQPIALPSGAVLPNRLVKGAMGVDDIHTMDEGSPFGHVCTPEEVADAVRFVVSDHASYLTGQRIGVDGGPF